MNTFEDSLKAGIKWSCYLLPSGGRLCLKASNHNIHMTLASPTTLWTDIAIFFIAILNYLTGYSNVFLHWKKKNSELSQWTHASRTRTHTQHIRRTFTLKWKKKKACNYVQSTSSSLESEPPRPILKTPDALEKSILRFDIYPTNWTIKS